MSTVRTITRTKAMPKAAKYVLYTTMGAKVIPLYLEHEKSALSLGALRIVSAKRRGGK